MADGSGIVPARTAMPLLDRREAYRPIGWSQQTAARGQHNGQCLLAGVPPRPQSLRCRRRMGHRLHSRRLRPRPSRHHTTSVRGHTGAVRKWQPRPGTRRPTARANPRAGGEAGPADPSAGEAIPAVGDELYSTNGQPIRVGHANHYGLTSGEPVAERGVNCHADAVARRQRRPGARVSACRTVTVGGTLRSAGVERAGGEMPGHGV